MSTRRVRRSRVSSGTMNSNRAGQRPPEESLQPLAERCPVGRAAPSADADGPASRQGDYGVQWMRSVEAHGDSGAATPETVSMTE